MKVFETLKNEKQPILESAKEAISFLDTKDIYEAFLEYMGYYEDCVPCFEGIGYYVCHEGKTEEEIANMPCNPKFPLSAYPILHCNNEVCIALSEYGLFLEKIKRKINDNLSHQATGCVINKQEKNSSKEYVLVHVSGVVHYDTAKVLSVRTANQYNQDLVNNNQDYIWIEKSKVSLKESGSNSKEYVMVHDSGYVWDSTARMLTPESVEIYNRDLREFGDKYQWKERFTVANTKPTFPGVQLQIKEL